MGEGPKTRASLLARLGNPQDQAAWQQFVELYGTLVYRFVRQRGLQDADAADLTQEVFLAIAQMAGRWPYDPQRGSFRGWLYGITRNKLAKFLQRQRSEPIGSGNTSHQRRLNEKPEREFDQKAAWELEFQQELFRLAAGQIQGSFASTTWQAFWQTAVEGKAVAAVAVKLRMSVGAVYVARSRVFARLTDQVQKMQME
jgi:RNA polymerase sigma-70 factor (ECF subfamily)